MSAEEFSKLSIGETMPVVTRAGAARAQTAPLTSHSSHSSLSSESSPSPLVVESSSSQLKYNLAVLDPETRKRAEQALSNNAIRMKYCTQTTEDIKEYIFHIDDDITVAIGGRYEVPKCTCGANEGGIACKHIYWIEDQLVRGAPDTFKANTLKLSVDGSAVNQMQPAQMLDRMSLEATTEGLKWVLYGGDEPEPGEAEEELVDLLSVFEPSGAFPEEFRELSESPTATERSRKFKEFSDVVTKYASEDIGLYSQIQAIITADFQALTFFDKVTRRTERIFKSLDEFISYGPADAAGYSNGVPACAIELKALVQKVEDFYEEQVEDNPGSRSLAIRAAACLITILDGVCKRNYNAYENTSLGELPAEPALNNLFSCLIGAPINDDGLFILDTLRLFPQDDVLRPHGEFLSNIGAQLIHNGTPLRYINAFRAITSDSRKRSGSEVAGGSAKRPMT